MYFTCLGVIDFVPFWLSIFIVHHVAGLSDVLLSNLIHMEDLALSDI